jgi:ATP-dependent exoDNAse (exonuclease V) alpha subunit
MNNNFKIGDKVICIKNEPIKYDLNMSNLKIGKHYTIIKINLTKTFIMIDNIHSWFRITNFYSKNEERVTKLKKIFK